MVLKESRTRPIWIIQLKHEGWDNFFLKKEIGSVGLDFFI